MCFLKKGNIVISGIHNSFLDFFEIKPNLPFNKKYHLNDGDVQILKQNWRSHIQIHGKRNSAKYPNRSWPINGLVVVFPFNFGWYSYQDFKDMSKSFPPIRNQVGNPVAFRMSGLNLKIVLAIYIETSCFKTVETPFIGM